MEEWKKSEYGKPNRAKKDRDRETIENLTWRTRAKFVVPLRYPYVSDLVDTT